MSTSISDVLGGDQETLKTIMSRVGEDWGTGSSLDPMFLGKGQNAHVYWMHDKKKVIKVSHDMSDADASEIVRKKPDKAFLKVYDVFQVDYKYIIISEKLSPISSKVKKDIIGYFKLCDNFRIITMPTMQFVDQLDYVLKTYNVGHLPETFPGWDRVRPQVELLQKLGAQKYLKKVGVSYSFIQQVAAWSRALDDRKIEWYDFTADNILMRGSKAVISDLGGNRCPHQSIPEIEV